MPEEVPDNSDAIAQLTAAMMQMRDVMEPVLEATRGYKAQLDELGIPEDIKGSMVGEYHQMLMSMILRSIQQGAENQ